jgi:hypothetical protein
MIRVPATTRGFSTRSRGRIQPPYAGDETGPRVLAGLFLAIVLLAASASPALAQYRPLPAGSFSTSNNPVGEPYHVEFAVNFWTPTPDIMIASESLGIPGSDIDVQANLGIESQSTYEFRVVLRPGRKHKFRFNYIPQKYEADTTLTGDIIFNGIKFPVSTQVGTLLEWKTYRIGYEYDFLSKPRWFLGFILEAKFTDINFELDSIIGTEYVRARAPIPAIGVIGRGWVTKNVAITGEFTAFKLPEDIDAEYGGHYYEWDIYGMVNFTKNLGAQIGWRSHDFAYEAELDRGSAKFDGIYFGGVVRF